MRAKTITVAEVEFTAFSLAKEMMTWDEPIPEFGTRFPSVLESCLNTPFTRFSRKDLYRGLIGKSTIMFYLMIKNHPFQNGNKRVAVMTLLLFLANNGKWLRMKPDDLYNFAVGIARSRPNSREKVVRNIYNTIEKYIIDFDQNE